MTLYKYYNPRRVYFILLIVTAASLALSPFMISVGIILLTVNWFAEGGIKEKFHLLKNNPALWVLISIYLLHLIGLLWTSDFTYALRDLKIKLPILILPVIIGTSEPLDRKQINRLLQFFIAGIVVSSLISLSVLLGFTGKVIGDARDISVFISHIRFSLLINIAIYSLFYLMFFAEQKSAGLRVFYGMVAGWLIIFLFLLQSLSGLVAFGVSALVLLVIWLFRIRNMMLRFFIVVSMLTLILIAASYVTHIIADFYTTDIVKQEELPKFTAHGNPYTHHLENDQTENGHYVWLYLSEKELKKAWNKRSSIDYDSLDERGNHIKYTLIRYLTSLGYRKDSAGVYKLSDEDVKAIESGFANHIFVDHYGLYPRIYKIIWEFNEYTHGSVPNGHSLTMRIEYLKGAFHIIKNHFWLGTGTGDTQLAFNQYYIENYSQLEKPYRRRAHNQYVTFFLTFGVFGFLWAITALVYPIIAKRGYRDFMFLVFIITAFISMFNEDTLETQAGATFFAFFYALFLFGTRGTFDLSLKKSDDKIRKKIKFEE